MLTNGQKKALHTAARLAGVDDEARRIVQRNVGGFYSAADRTATRHGFIACMGFYEGLCEKRGMTLGATPGYWQRQNAEANPTDALVFAIDRVGKQLGWDRQHVNNFLAGPHMSGGQGHGFDDIAAAPAYWLRRLLDGMKAMARRNRPVVPGAGGSGSPAPGCPRPAGSVGPGGGSAA